jgi:hypothetical protein
MAVHFLFVRDASFVIQAMVNVDQDCYAIEVLVFLEKSMSLEITVRIILIHFPIDVIF